MKRKSTLINTLKSSITDTKDSEIFGQNLYESSNFNASIDTEYIISAFHTKSAYSNIDYGTKGSDFSREELNKRTKFGRNNASEFKKTKLKWK